MNFESEHDKRINTKNHLLNRDLDLAALEHFLFHSTIALITDHSAQAWYRTGSLLLLLDRRGVVASGWLPTSSWAGSSRCKSVLTCLKFLHRWAPSSNWMRMFFRATRVTVPCLFQCLSLGCWTRTLVPGFIAMMTCSLSGPPPLVGIPSSRRGSSPLKGRP